LKPVEGIRQLGHAHMVVITSHVWVLVLLIVVASMGMVAVVVSWLLLSWWLLCQGMALGCATCCGWGCQWFESWGCVSIVNFVECYDGGEDVLEWAG